MLTLPPGVDQPGGSSGQRVTGGLFFRVGTADEAVPIAGITHLIEHLAIGQVRTGEADENGQTSDRWTLFHATGTVQEVVAYLNGVCRALHSLPLERLEKERQIIHTEASHRDGASPFREERYGAAGYGMAAIEEFGMFTISEQTVREWAARWFTRGNAVAFLTTDRVPEGLELALPRGERRPDPDPGEWVAETPSYFLGGGNGIALQGIVVRSWAAKVYVRMMAGRLFRTLREDRGLSYVADADYATRDGRTGAVTLFADALPDRLVEVSEAFVGLVRDSSSSEVTDDELAAAIRGVRRELAPATPASFLPTQAIAELDGRPVETLVEMMTELDAVSADEVRKVARQVWETCLIHCDPVAVQVVEAAEVGPKRNPGPAPQPLRWTKEFEKKGLSREVMQFGDQGINYQAGGVVYRVVFDEACAVFCWPDGARAVMARDASMMIIEPGLYKWLDKTRMIRLIDDKVDPAKLVWLPERDHKDIPRYGAKQALRLGALILLLS
ncbi:MAG: insulinase family protein, partial [Propionibacteriales bacterium]|nr:insulinase family protein [Propionibacteriales bacterium]